MICTLVLYESASLRSASQTFGTRQDDVSIQRFSLKPQSGFLSQYMYVLIVHTPTDRLTLSTLPSVDALSVSYRMSLYGISLYHVRKQRPEALYILLLTTTKGSSGR